MEANGVLSAVYDPDNRALRISGGGGGTYPPPDSAEGVPGPAGPEGPQGDQGIQGQQGAQGVPGPQGETGPEGPQGSEGLPGPKGPTGAQGPQGPQGITGQGIRILGEKATPAQLPSSGNTAGDAWIVTSDGDLYIWSTDLAPSQWVDAGQIVGPQGPQGPQGVQGPIGLTGSQGTTGNQGPAGAAGTQGTQGIQGIQGPQGNPGAQGATGPGGWELIDTVTTAEGNQSTTGQALVNTGLAVALGIGRYEFDAVLRASAATGTAGTRYAFAFTGTATGDAIVTGTASATTSAECSTTLGTATAQTYITVNGGTGVVFVRWFIYATTTGTLTIQHLKVTSGTSTVSVGSTLRARAIPT